MPSGSKMRSRRNTSSGWPEIFSTRTATKSVDAPYCQWSPGWNAPGMPAARATRSPRVANGSPSLVTRRISSSDSPASSGFNVSPEVWVSTWRMVTGRASGTRRRRGPSRSRTRWSAYSGIQSAIGSSRRKRPSSNSIMRAVETMGLVIDIRVKMASVVIGCRASRSRHPTAE